MRILIAGASGAIGRPLVRRLRANQNEVFALTRSPDSAPALKEIGAEPVIADALDAAAVKAAVGRIRPDAVINELTSLPRHYTPAEMKAAAERDRKVRVEGNNQPACGASRCGRAPLPAAKFRILVCARRGAGGRVRPVHLHRVPGSRGQRPHLPGIGSARIGDAGNPTSSRYVTDSSTAPALGTRARAISVIRCGNSSFRLSVRARASTASCISTMRPGRLLPRWNARRERTTSSTETRRLSTCG
jgi:hypothetical protein